MTQSRLKPRITLKSLKNLDGNVNMLKAEVERLNDRRKSIEGNIDRLKENLKQTMILTGKEKIKTDLFNITVANNPEAVNVIDETKIPKKYFIKKVIQNLDKLTIKTLLKEGKKIKGVELTQGKGLRIK